jgi:peptide/nickel transport system substrate-binding protein
VRDPRDRSAFARLLVLLLAVGLVAAACGEDDEAESAREGDTSTTGGGGSQEGGTVTFAAEQEPAGWNINTATDSDVVLQHLVIQVYPKVFEVLPDLSVALDTDLMESAELTSEDPQVVEYVIKEEAVWSDGTPISAADFTYRWESSNGSNPDIDIETTIGYELIETLEASDDGKTVTATFSSPYADWQGLFDNLLPAHIMPTLADDPVAAWNDGLDGADIPTFSGGPWMLTEYVPEQSVTLVPNEGYWGEMPKLDSIVVRFGIEAEAIPQALENGEIDVAYPQPQVDLVSQIEALAPEVEATTQFGTSFEHIDFNLDNPLLGDLAVRQAIAHGLDREGIVERTVAQFDDEATQLDNSIWLTNQEQYEPHGEEYAEQDLDAARSVLEDAGYSEGSDGVYEKDGERLSLRISTTGGNALREATQQVIQSQLGEVGIEITIDNVEGRAVFERFYPESDSRDDLDYDIALYSWVGTPFPSGSGALYKTPDPPGTVGLNTMGYANPEVDALYEEAAASTDQEVVADKLNQVDELLWEDLPTIPLYQKPTYLPFRSSIQGIQDNPSTYGPLWNADEWSLAAS